MGTPTIGTTKMQIAHSLDYVGQRFGLYRYPDETLAGFRARVLDVFVHKANASTVGLEYGLARELGAVSIPIGKIRVLRDINEVPLATAPGIEITPSTVTFYSNFLIGTVDMRFDLVSRFPRPDIASAFYIEDIYDYVVGSTYWEWEVEPTATERWLQAKYLVPRQNFNIRRGAIALHKGLTYLPNKNIISGTIGSGNELVETEVASIAAVNALGKYYVDYSNSYIYTYDDLQGPTAATISYSYFLDSWSPMWVPVSVDSLADTTMIARLLLPEKASDNISYTGTVYDLDVMALILEAYRRDGSFWFATDSNDTPIDALNTYHVSDIVTDPLDRFYLDMEQNIRDLLRES